MAKKRDEELNIVDKTKVVKRQLKEEMERSFIAYAMAVNVSRAIPDVRDGLKPVHRRILYAMHDMGIHSDKPHKKCARIVGEVLGKYHPHGDSSVYMALVRMGQPFSIRNPLIDGQGNFGSIDNDPPAAMRYTEARLSKIAGELLRDIDKETVDWAPNFDDTLEQPTILPSKFPNLLVNGSDGIAVGMATNIPPHNLSECIDAVTALIDDPDISIDDLCKFMPAPDYPTGGIIMGRMNIRHAYRTGRGGVVTRAKCEIEEYKAKEGGEATRQRIIITELPYQVCKEDLVIVIAGMVKDKRIEGIADLKDESDRTGIRIVIDVKRDAQAPVVLNLLYKHTNLQVSNGIIFLSLVNGEPKILNLKEMLYYYLEHQKEIIVRRTKFDLEKALEREHIVEGLVKALANIDEVIKIIKQSRDKFEASEKLQAKFILSDKQANAILEMRLQRLTSLEVEKLNEELAELQLLIAKLKGILADPQKVLDIIKEELLEIKNRFGEPRRTELQVDYDEIDIGDLIDKEDVVISMTHFGYIKRLPKNEYKAQKRGGKGITAHKPKEADFVEKMFVTNTHDNLLFFTNAGKVYVCKAYEIPEAERTARGRAIVNLLQLGEGEKVTAVIKVEEDGYRGNLMMATKKGLIKKTALAEFENIRKVGKRAITLLEGDELMHVQLTSGRDEILMASHEGKCIRFSEENVRRMGRTSQGVRSMKLNPNDYVVDMAVVVDGYEVLTISENGYGKRSDLEDYRLQSRAGKGILAGQFNEKTGKLVNLKLIDPENDIMIIADNGIIIRMRAKEVSNIGRNTQGVRMMRLKNEGKVVCVALTPPEAEELDDSEEGEGSEE